MGINGSHVMPTLPRPAVNINKFRSPIISPVKASDYPSNWFLNTTRLSFLTCPHGCRIGLGEPGSVREDWKGRRSPGNRQDGTPGELS